METMIVILGYIALVSVFGGIAAWALTRLLDPPGPPPWNDALDDNYCEKCRGECYWCD